MKVAEDKRDGVFDAVNSAVQKLQSKVIRAVTQVEERPHNVFPCWGGSYLIETAIRKHFETAKVIMVDNPSSHYLWQLLILFIQNNELEHG